MSLPKYTVIGGPKLSLNSDMGTQASMARTPYTKFHVTIPNEPEHDIDHGKGPRIENGKVLPTQATLRQARNIGMAATISAMALFGVAESALYQESESYRNFSNAVVEVGIDFIHALRNPSVPKPKEIDPSMPLPLDQVSLGNTPIYSTKTLDYLV